MKKRLGLLALVATISTLSYSASIDHIQTYTPEYLGNQAQNGMTNRASVYYNPAGLTELENGTYFQVGTQIAVGHEKMEYKGREYKADLLQPIPNISAFKVEDDSALYWTFGGLGGGGDLEYKDGVPGTAVIGDLLPAIAGKGIALNPLLDATQKKYFIGLLSSINTEGSYAEGANLYAQTTIGKAWKLNDKFSVSAGGRVVYGMRNLKGKILINGDKNLQILGLPVGDTAEIDSRRDAWGFGAQFGINYNATEKLNLAMRYDSRIKMNFSARGNEKKVSLGGQELGFGNFYPEYAIGTKLRRDLPAILALGGSYKVTDDWTVALSGNYYFNKDAKLDYISSGNLSSLGIKPVDLEYDNGWEIALGTEYKINQKWALLGSVNYANTGAKSSSYDDIEYALDSITLGAGVKYMPNEDIEWAFTVSHFFYSEQEGHYAEKYKNYGLTNPKYDKSITAIGVSYSNKF